MRSWSGNTTDYWLGGCGKRTTLVVAVLLYWRLCCGARVKNASKNRNSLVFAETVYIMLCLNIASEPSKEGYLTPEAACTEVSGVFPVRSGHARSTGANLLQVMDSARTATFWSTGLRKGRRETEQRHRYDQQLYIKTVTTVLVRCQELNRN